MDELSKCPPNPTRADGSGIQDECEEKIMDRHRACRERNLQTIIDPTTQASLQQTTRAMEKTEQVLEQTVQSSNELKEIISKLSEEQTILKAKLNELSTQVINLSNRIETENEIENIVNQQKTVENKLEELTKVIMKLLKKLD